MVGQDADLQSNNPTLHSDKTMGCEASTKHSCSDARASFVQAVCFRDETPKNGMQVFVTHMHGALRAAVPALAEAAQ